MKLKGRVVSNKMTKTAVVLVEGTRLNRMYRKTFVYSNKYLVDDSFGVKIGDIVEFEKCAPISKRKHWKIVKVVGRDMVAVETEVMKTVATDAIEEVMPEEAEKLTANSEQQTASKDEQLTANSPSASLRASKPLTASEKPKKAVSRKPASQRGELKAVSEEAE